MLHHYGNNHGTFFSFLFPTSSKHSSANNTKSPDQEYYPNNTSLSSVDCTLSLGTPSTRHAETTRSKPHSGSCMSSLPWDINVSNNSNNANNEMDKNASKHANGSTRITRRCANCDTTSTPLWRNGPKGPKSLCNACGIRYKKEERRAATTVISPAVDCRSAYEYGYGYQNSHQWACYGSSVTKTSSVSPYGEDMSWRVNMAQPQQFPFLDRNSLFPYN